MVANKSINDKGEENDQFGRSVAKTIVQSAEISCPTNDIHFHPNIYILIEKISSHEMM